ncbi:hypothetical protein A3709_08940 [Halioglobus sp. HI00S01]|uniref:hypothetical protein n=1 Tax=Halioglobus sp. HI00S01 TaxID=1822214 RepID=UPI0007C20498|nr:hypothetical protein [Halioglobus sp. HI00S01]KZX55105.1 hypothetical protein A3709_08940 [Halioglobus sp. HI00S01]
MKCLSKLALAACLALSTAACAPEKATVADTPIGPDHSKPGAPITLVSDSSYRSEVGAELNLTLSLRAHATERLTVAIKADSALNLISPLTPVELTRDSDGRFNLDISVRTPAAGRHYLRIYATTAGQGASMSRSMSVGIQVGDPPSSTQKSSTNADQGEKLRRMKAEEFEP